MNWDDIRAAIKDAQAKLSVLDGFATDLATMIAGRLHRVKSPDTLRAMKRELQDFDSRTGDWKR